MLKRILKAFSLTVMLLFAGHLAAAAPANQAQRSAANPLITEMTMVETAVRDTVSAIAQGDTGRVAKSIESLREPMQKAQQALQAGAVSLPKNGDRLDEFQRSYDSFHAQVEALGRAGNRNNIEAVLMITKQLLESCVTCHRTFRK